ncbi:CCR4-NOT transcription complex subunit 10 isoform X2 [Thrips palmi]|nr:CCR4-NOT transcription complex subunit 10 isoform X2 [Thrips palmi]
MVDKDSSPVSSDKSGNGNSADVVSPSFTDQDRELAQAALLEFNNGNYGACLQSLTKLEATCGQDLKLGHNKAVAEYFKSDLRKTNQFKKSFDALCAQAHINFEDANSLEDVDHCIFYFNHSIRLFHLKQYATAFHLMSKVFSLIEPMEETLAQRVSMLLLELLLQTHQPEKALPHVSYIEQQFTSTSTLPVGKLSGEKDVKTLDKSDKEKNIEPVDLESDPTKLRLLHFKIRCLLKTHQLSAARKELSLISGIKNNLPSIFLRANLEYLSGNYRRAMRVLNTVSGNIQSFKDIGEHIPALYYNNMGCVHHYIGKPNLSTFYLKKALTEEEEAMKALAAENDGSNGQPLYTLGSNHNIEMKHNLGLALLHAGRPSQAFDLLVDAVRVFHMNPRLWLRLAECCIMVYKKSNGEDFNIAQRRQDMVQGVVGNGIHKKIILSPQLAREVNSQREEISSAIPSTSLEFASLCLRNALSLLNEHSASLKNGNVETSSSLRLAGSHLGGLQGLSTGLNIAGGGLGALGAPGTTLGFGGGAAKAPVQKSCYGAPSAPLSETEVESLRCSVLVNSAYVALCLGDYIMALKHAQDLLAQPKLCGTHKLLGHLYAAEAYLMCNKISDAIDHLNPDNIKDVNLEYPGQTELDKEKANDPDKDAEESKRNLQNWCPNKLGTARAVLQYNLAVAFATRGELDKAGETLKRVFAARGPECEVPTHVVMLALYLELQLGHSDVSRSIVRQHCPQYK